MKSRLLVLVTWILFLSLVAPLVALAQEAPAPDGGEGFLAWLGNLDLMAYAVIALAAVELAKRIAAVIPGKKDDEMVSVADAFVRKLVDFIAGKTGKASDPSLVVRE